MKTRVFLFLAAAVLLAGCAKEIQAPLEDQTVVSGPITLQVGINNPKDDLEVEPTQASTRTVLGEKVGDAYPVYWSKGDQIQINDKTSDALTEVAAFTSSTSFNFSEAPTAPYNVLYPASIYKDASHVTLPAVQTYKAGGFADKMFPMAGYSADGSNITINHLCAIVKVSVKRSADSGADTDNIAAVRFKGRASEKVSGNFEIDYSTPALAAATGTGAELEVRVVESLATSTSDAVVYYLVVPARAYASGFDIIVTDANNDIMTKTKSGAVTLAAGKMYSMAEFAFEPSGTDTGIEIASAEDLIAFATAFNNGDYIALGGLFRATVTADIAFDATSSDAFNLTGGIGTKDDGNGGTNYFNGVFDGNNYTISGLEATVPLFAYTGKDGDVKNLTLNDDCSFTFTHKNDDEGTFGAIVGYHKGTIDNVKVAADVSLADKTGVTNMTSLGGLVGYANGGVIQNGSVYSGLISTPAGFKSTKKLIIGGLAGRIKTSSSNITGSYFKGAISNAAEITSTDNADPYLIIGGVVGFVDGGASVSSSNSTADHADEASAYSGFNGKIVNKTTVAYNSAVGGIVGELNNGIVSSCTNAATIACSVYRTGDNCRYMKSGGIVGKVNANGTVTGCTNTNNGTVQHRSNPKYQDLGGIAGYNAGTISNCTNNAAVNQMTSGQKAKAGRYVYLGGVIGENIADNKVSDVHNTAALQISSMEDVENSSECIGGVIGYNKGIVVGGASKDITNSGEVYHSPTFTQQFQGYNLGGIVGLTEAAVKNAKNTGRAYFRWNGTPTLGASKVYLGGIAGRASGASSTIENCENVVEAGVANSAQVYFYLPANISYSGNYIGGIVGLTDATNPVKDCTNGGEVRTAAGASTVPVTDIKMGGIIGKMTGSGTVDNADNSGRVRINFIACTESTDSHSGNYLGGIVGYVINESAVTVTGCDNSGQVDITNGAGLVQDHIASGVVGRMDAPGSITNCKNNGGTIQMAITANSVGPKDLYAAGVLGYSVSDVTISGCSNSGAISGGNGTRKDGTAYYTGGIVAYLKGSSKILNCSNTGSTVSTHAGNNDTIGSTSLTGGIAGFVEGTSENPIEIGGTTGCTINTSTELSALRGWIAGVAAYAKYVQISKCTVESNVGGGCAARGAGGIVGKAEYCTINGSLYKGDQIKANQIQKTTGLGGIVGNMSNSTVDGCYCYATKFYNSNSQPFGGIVGVSVSNNTIQNCHYKSAVEGPTTGKAATAQVAGSGSFDGGGNLADL